jgi:hypothetical protein
MGTSAREGSGLLLRLSCSSRIGETEQVPGQDLPLVKTRPCIISEHS